MLQMPHLSSGAVMRAVAVLCLLACVVTPVRALQVEVAAGEILELTEPVAAETIMTFQFIVDNDQTLDVKLLSKDGEVVNDFTKEATNGMYAVEAGEKTKVVVLRLDNSASTFTAVRVNVHFRHAVNHNFAANVRQLDPIEQKIHALSAAMTKLQTLQVTLRTQQKNHRSTVEDANERVLLWSVFQVVALVAMSGFQLFFLKRFLEKKSFV